MDYINVDYAVKLTNSFVLYYYDDINLEEFINLASDEIKEQLMK